MRQVKLFLMIFCITCLHANLFSVLRLKHNDFSYWVHPEEPRDKKRRVRTNYPYICGNAFRNFCDFIFDETSLDFDPSQVTHGATIFVRNQNDFLDYFFKKFHPQIKAKYILITHNSICRKGKEQFKKYLDDENIFAWFGKNLTLDHPKAFPIPLGIGSWYWTFGKKNCIDNIINNLPEKDKFLCMNFKIGKQQERRGPIRKKVFTLFKNKSFCYNAGLKPFKRYLVDIARSKFVLSPEGNGIDCHRTWEAMLLGSYPIITGSKIDCLFEDLPVLIIQDWNEITPEFLNAKYEELSRKTYKLERLYADYWIAKIAKVQQELKKMGESE